MEFSLDNGRYQERAVLTGFQTHTVCKSKPDGHVLQDTTVKTAENLELHLDSKNGQMGISITGAQECPNGNIEAILTQE